MVKLLGLCIFAMSFFALAGTEGHALVKERGLQLYRIPKVSPPANWAIDEKMSQYYQMIALAPQGKSFGDSASVMYARALYEPKRKFSLEQHIQSDIANFQSRDSKAVGNPRDAVKDQDKNSWRIVDFVYSEGKTTNYETVAYIEEGEYIFHFALSSRSKDEFATFRPQLLQWVASYRNLPETGEQDKQSSTLKIK